MKNKTNKLKSALPALVLICAGMIVASCEKEENDAGPTTYVEYKFFGNNLKDLFSENTLDEPNSTLKYYINHPAIRTIYLSPSYNDPDFKAMPYFQITILKERYLEPIIKYSPKICGRGDFNFIPGEASKIPNDSLWFVQNGWTINKALQNQK